MPNDDRCPACDDPGGPSYIGGPQGPSAHHPGITIYHDNRSQKVPKEEIIDYLQGSQSAYCEHHMSRAIKRGLSHLDELHTGGLEFKIDHDAGTITMTSKEDTSDAATITFLDAVGQLARA